MRVTPFARALVSEAVFPALFLAVTIAVDVNRGATRYGNSRGAKFGNANGQPLGDRSGSNEGSASSVSDSNGSTFGSNVGRLPAGAFPRRAKRKRASSWIPPGATALEPRV